MCYNVIDIESEICELECIFTRGGPASADVFLWRIAQIVAGVRIGTKSGNRKISFAIDRIERAMEHIPKTKNKKDLEIIIRDKKEEIKNLESQRENLAPLI